MSTPAELKRILKEIIGISPNLPVIGKVIRVEADHCTVKIAGGLELTDVKLKATIGNSQFLTLSPTVGSSVVMISLTGKLDNMTVIKLDAVEKIEYQQNGLVISADSTDQKIQVKNDTCSFKELLQDLTNVIKELKVFTPVGASGVPLPDVQLKLSAFETKFKTLLK
jgi:hypothetical protein